MRTKKLRIGINESFQSVSIVLSDADEERLNGFVLSVEELKGLQVIQEGFRAKINMKGSEGKPVNIITTGPSSDDLSAVLHKLRPLILKKEPFYFHRICNIIARSTSQTVIGRFLAEQKNLFDGKRSQSTFKIKVNDLVLNSDEAVTQWLNAFQYHRDADHRRMFKDLYSSIPSSFCESLFVQAIIDKVNAVMATLELIRMILGMQKSVKILAHN